MVDYVVSILRIVYVYIYIHDYTCNFADTHLLAYNVCVYIYVYILGISIVIHIVMITIPNCF